MTEFNTPPTKSDGVIIDENDWNDDLVNNLIALHERAPVCYPHKQVANTTTETELFSHTIPAGMLGAKGFIQVEFSGMVKNASGGTRTLSLAVRWGTSTISSPGFSIATSAYGTTLNARFMMQNLNNYAQQYAIMHLFYSTSPTIAGSIQGLTDVSEWNNHVFDTSLEEQLSFTAQWDSADASCVFDMLCAFVIGPIYKT